MGGIQIDLGWAAFIIGLHEPAGAEAPVIAGFKASEAVFWFGCAQVIAEIFGIGQKFGRHHRADCVAACVLFAGVAGAVAEIPRYRIG